MTGPKRKYNKKKLEIKGVSSTTLLKGVAPPPKKLDLFVGRLDPATTREAVESHVNWVLGGKGKATAEEISHCVSAYGYKGYKVTVPAEAAESVLHPDKWPSYVAIRKFYRPKGQTVSTNSTLSSKPLTRATSLNNVALCV